jgi:hypothetical protein
MKSFGKLRGLRKETARIDAIIREEFGRIEPEDLRCGEKPVHSLLRQAAGVAIPAIVLSMTSPPAGMRKSATN